MPNPRYKPIEFDKLQMYFRMPYVIDIEGVEGKITVTQPSIYDIAFMGEKKFYSTLNIFITNTTSYRSMLWDIKLDWNNVSDFDLFCMLYQGIDQEVSDILFEGIVWSNFQLYTKKLPDSDDEIRILYDKENHIEINEEVYQNFHQALQYMFSMKPEEELTKDPMLKRWWIDKDKKEAKRAQEKQEKGEESTSSLVSLISSCINHPGFKYDLDGLKNMGVCQFYDSVKRLQLYENATACLKGMFSGFVDGSKIPADSYNFMKEI